MLTIVIYAYLHIYLVGVLGSMIHWPRVAVRLIGIYDCGTLLKALVWRASTQAHRYTYSIYILYIYMLLFMLFILKYAVYYMYTLILILLPLCIYIMRLYIMLWLPFYYHLHCLHCICEYHKLILYPRCILYRCVPYSSTSTTKSCCPRTASQTTNWCCGSSHRWLGYVYSCICAYV